MRNMYKGPPDLSPLSEKTRHSNCYPSIRVEFFVFFFNLKSTRQVLPCRVFAKHEYNINLLLWSSMMCYNIEKTDIQFPFTPRGVIVR